MHAIGDQEFAQFQRFIYESAGISLSPGKKALVSGAPGAAARTDARVELRGLFPSAHQRQGATGSADGDRPADHQRNLLFPRAEALRAFCEAGRSAIRLAAAAYLERRRVHRTREAYSIAMLLGDCRGGHPWEIVASDISMRVLQRARAGHYPMERALTLSREYLQRTA